MSTSIEERLPALFDSVPGPPDAPHEVYRRLQFLSRVLRNAQYSGESAGWLFWFSADGEVRSAAMRPEGIVIGRNSGCDVVLADARTSRRHCRVTRGHAGVAIEDLGSSNGALVNGRRLSGVQLLQDGDIIEIGGTALAFLCAGRERPGG